MLLQPTVDLREYYDAHGVITPEDRARLMETSDAWFEELGELRRSVSAGVCSYKGRINEKLQERTPEAYEDIVEFLGEESFASTARYDDELMIFSCTATIYRLEEGSVEKCIYDQIEYIEDFLNLYAEVGFLFRRIIQKLPYDEGLNYIGEKGLSVFALEQMLQEMPIGGKAKIADCLASYFDNVGKQKEAEYLRRVMEVQHG